MTRQFGADQLSKLTGVIISPVAIASHKKLRLANSQPSESHGE